MTDTEKKIAEIREGLTFIVGEQSAGKWMGRCRFLLSELERLEREYAEERAAHNAHVTESCEKEEECRKLRKELDLLQELAVKVTVEREKERKSAQQEIERLREENEGRKKIIEAYMRIEHDLAEEAERYLQQRDKLIEALKEIVADLGDRWKQADERWEREADVYAQGEAVAYDYAEYRLIEAIKRVEVTVE